MAPTATRSTAPLVVVAVLVLGAIAYLGWRVYDAPVDEYSAGRVAVRASDVVVRAGSGDASLCSAMRDVSAPDDGEASVQRCVEIASRTGSGGPGWLGVRDLRATKVDVGRSSGSVTVSGTLVTPGPALPLVFTWPVTREDGTWVVSGGPDVQVD